jgi:xylan 1,4-beta-xylosidase
MMKEQIIIKEGTEVPFYNNVDYCIGTGRMGLALTEEYQKQLKLVQNEIGFRYIRGHGLFCGDMAIYQEYEENGVKKAEYNCTYLDRVMDNYQQVGLRPFLELGFMPEKLASGSQTVFYWKGNVTPPQNYDNWTDMVQALLRHLMERYGEDEAVQWPVEVWNEPNLNIFWEDADMAEYFKLFEKTFHTVKKVDARFQVGGPAVCGGTDEIWIQKFMEFCRERKLAIDFVTRHHYTIEPPDKDGHYNYSLLMKAEDGFANLQTTRNIIDSFPEYKGLPIHITEFNTSYTPQGVIHDTNRNAALIARQLSRLGDVNESYSYWTFGDVFEEAGVPFTPFYGGFGLTAEGCIPKPTFWTFVFYKKLKKNGGSCIYRDNNMVLLRKANGDYSGIIWNASEQNALVEAKQVELVLPAQEKEYCIMTRTVDEEVCNPLKVWHDWGEPAHLKEEQRELLREAARPCLQTKRIAARNQTLSFILTAKENAVVYFEICGAPVTPDRGYDYERAVGLKDAKQGL